MSSFSSLRARSYHGTACTTASSRSKCRMSSPVLRPKINSVALNPSVLHLLIRQLRNDLVPLNYGHVMSRQRASGPCSSALVLAGVSSCPFQPTAGVEPASATLRWVTAIRYSHGLSLVVTHVTPSACHPMNWMNADPMDGCSLMTGGMV